MCQPFCLPAAAVLPHTHTDSVARSLAHIHTERAAASTRIKGDFHSLHWAGGGFLKWKMRVIRENVLSPSAANPFLNVEKLWRKNWNKSRASVARETFYVCALWLNRGENAAANTHTKWERGRMKEREREKRCVSIPYQFGQLTFRPASWNQLSGNFPISISVSREFKSGVPALPPEEKKKSCWNPGQTNCTSGVCEFYFLVLQLWRGAALNKWQLGSFWAGSFQQLQTSPRLKFIYCLLMMLKTKDAFVYIYCLN